MKITTIVLALLASTVCFASGSETSDVEVSERFAKAKQISLEQAESPEAKEYFGAMAKFWQKTLTKSASKCQAGSGDGVELILKVNEQGGIDEVIGSPWNKKSKCYAKVISGQTAPTPPEHPFFLSSVLP
jgi:hypothetical protein